MRMKKFVMFLMMMLILSTSTMLLAFDSTITKPSATAPEGISPMATTILGAIQWVGYAIALRNDNLHRY